jgi:hypothetical protein
MRLLTVALLTASISCRPNADRASAVESVGASSMAATSTATSVGTLQTEISPPFLNSSLQALDVARWRGATTADKADSLMADALSAEGEFNADDTYYEFTGDTLRITRLSQQPGVVPRLVDCLGWDKRSNAKWKGSKLLVGVICGQALMNTPYADELRKKGAYPNTWVDFRNPTLEQAREAQSKWQATLSSHPSAG